SSTPSPSLEALLTSPAALGNSIRGLMGRGDHHGSGSSRKPYLPTEASLQVQLASRACGLFFQPILLRQSKLSPEQQAQQLSQHLAALLALKVLAQFHYSLSLSPC